MRAVLFPGQGTQRIGMGQMLAKAFPESAAVLEADRTDAGEHLRRLIRRGPLQELTRTENAQAAITVVSLAALAAYRRRGPGFDIAAGHSVGVLAAAAASGMISDAEAIRLAGRRGAIMGRLPAGGSMISAAGLPIDAVQAVVDAAVRDGAILAVGLVNGPATAIISGATADVEAARENLLGATVVELAVSHAFHSPLMEPGVAEWTDVVGGALIGDADIPLVCDGDGTVISTPDQLRTHLIGQLTGPVRWDLVCRSIIAHGVTEAVEVGDSKAIRSMCRSYPELHVDTMALPATLSQLKHPRSVAPVQA